MFLITALNFIIASVIIIPLERNVSRNDTECPGDTIPYICSIWSNSDKLQLTWRVILPGQQPLNITYHGTSNYNDVDFLNDFVTTSLTQFTNDQYIESMLTFIVSNDISTNWTVRLECLIEDLNSTMVYVTINLSGRFRYI